MRVPFDPPYTKDDLEQLDILHASIGLDQEWKNSKRRKELEKTELVISETITVLSQELQGL